ncbi:MAG: hypothetical protein PVH17_10365 [Anaerolineae bacterium]|jgi:hypothetical protein
MSKKEARWALLASIVVVGLTCLPYLVAWQLAPAGMQYTGLLINHFDGESYYAKMQQGAHGDWLFHLPFTPEPHNGAFIFTFYLALGHLAVVLGLPIPVTYHLARVAASLVFLLIAYRFIARFFDRLATRRTAFLLMAFSAGLGWLMAPLGVTTADFWVAEGFTFLSIMANPHFPLAMGLMLLISMSVLDRLETPLRLSRLLGIATLGLLLAVVQPFAVPIILIVLSTYLAVLALRDRCLPSRQILISGAVGLGAAPVMLYDLYVYRTNPALKAWSAQNLTPSLPAWDYALGYGLVLLLAIVGIWVTVRRRRSVDLFLLSWVGVVVILLYVPFALQRRFITGLHIPLTLLAAIGLEQVIWPRLASRRRALITGLLVGLTALTNAFVPLVSVAGVAQGRHPLVMTQDEAGACAWLREQTTWTDTVLTPTQSGQFIPAWAGNRVVYGHPFETIEAENKETEVIHFYSAGASAADRRALLRRYNVRYVLGPPRVDLGTETLGLAPAWTGDDVILYRVGTGP